MAVENQMKVFINRGGKRNETNKDTTSSTPVNTKVADKALDESEVAMFHCHKKVEEGRLSVKSAAFIIVAEIRNIYYSTCVRNSDVFDIQTFIYMDQMLFDPLAELVCSVIKYGKKSINVDMMKRTVAQCIESIEYEVDINKINHVIDLLYRYFTDEIK